MEATNGSIFVIPNYSGYPVFIPLRRLICVYGSILGIAFL